MRIGITIFLLLFLIRGRAQSKKENGFKHQLTFTGDNDVLAFKGTDRYYTSGLFINYAVVKKVKKNNLVKQINEWEIGQQIYNANKREVYLPEELDRPIAGYLYAKFQNNRYKKNNQLLSYGVSIATIGKASLAEPLIDFIHPLLKINSSFWGWIYDYQLKDEIGLNLHGKYVVSAIKNRRSFYQLSSETNITAGTSLTNISEAVIIQLGRFNEMHESEFWHSKLNENGKRIGNNNELFLFYKPEIVYQIYDATIQGGMFRKDKGQSASSPKPFLIYNNIGIMVSNERVSTSLCFVTQSKQTVNQMNDHAFGRVKVAVRF